MSLKDTLAALKAKTKTDIVTGLNISDVTKKAIAAAKEGAMAKASEMVVTNKTIQEKAGAAIEQGAVTGVAQQIAQFYNNNKKAIMIGAISIPAGIIAYFLLRKKKQT